jgi:hypothetical protein
MKLETAIPAMNTATLLPSTTTKAANGLGWASMPSFPVQEAITDFSLGWDAMPAFGHSQPVSGDAELVANFVRTTRLANTAPSPLESFWSHMSLLCVKP